MWQLGVMTPGRRVPGGTQLALPVDLPASPSLRRLSEWERMLADDDTIGLTTRTHPMVLLRERLGANVVSSAGQNLGAGAGLPLPPGLSPVSELNSPRTRTEPSPTQF